jgi:hypothetical protein
MHTFAAWITVNGFNEDRQHVSCVGPCSHFRMWDWDRANCKAIMRIIRKRKPFYFRIMVGRKYRTIFRLGRKVDV